LDEPLATVLRAVVFLSRAEVLLYAVAGGSAFLCAWHIFAFLKGATAPVKEDIARTHCETIGKKFARVEGCDGIDAREPLEKCPIDWCSREKKRIIDRLYSSPSTIISR
jgi:hypothetical protein